MAYKVNEELVAKLTEVSGTCASSVFIYYTSQWSPCSHSHEYGHMCCLNCGAEYNDHGASKDIPLPPNGRSHLVCKKLREPEHTVYLAELAKRVCELVANDDECKRQHENHDTGTAFEKCCAYTAACLVVGKEA